MFAGCSTATSEPNMKDDTCMRVLKLLLQGMLDQSVALQRVQHWLRGCGCLVVAQGTGSRGCCADGCGVVASKALMNHHCFADDLHAGGSIREGEQFMESCICCTVQGYLDNIIQRFEDTHPNELMQTSCAASSWVPSK